MKDDCATPPVDERAIGILAAKGEMTCQQLGEHLWGRKADGSWRRKAGTAPYARAAGRVLHRLLRARRVFQRSDGHHTLWGAILKNGKPLGVIVR